MLIRASAALAAILFAVPLGAASYYSVPLEDAKAVSLTPGRFAVHGDGKADDTAALQQAIDQAQEAANQGIVFVPQGRYRLTKTVYVWPGIRLIGVGAERPVFVLGNNTPGFQQAPTYMVFFAGSRPGFARKIMEARLRAEQKAAPGSRPAEPIDLSWFPPADSKPPDANPGTFYSAISNIDFEIGEGNPGAVAIRSRYAQHCYLAHIDFHLGSGYAGINGAGNLAEDLHFYGGTHGIVTGKPSPGWQFTLVDGSFEGQRESAIQEHEAGLTLVRPHFKNVPTAIAIDPGYSDELFVKDARMEDVRGPAVVISNELRNRTEINFEGAVCHNVPVFASFRESGKSIEGKGGVYEVSVFSHGLRMTDLGAAATISTVLEAKPLAALPAAVKSDIPDLPARNTWVNIRKLGAVGDGKADDTEAFRKAIAAHRAIYIPSGKYRVTDTLALRPDTALIGLHPSATQIVIDDHTAAFQGIGSPKPVIEAPQGGTNILIGFGVYTNAINPRAVAVKWMAGKDSLINDVRFLGGHGTVDPTWSIEESFQAWRNLYNNNHTADPDLNRRWDGQYPSLWVTNGGGGTFLDIWTPSTFAQAGMYISDTTTEGRIYEISSEHHVRNEVKLRNVSNWRIYALQTEEERGESGFALPLEIANSSNITVANLHMYRVVSAFQPFPYAVKVTDSHDIRFRNIHCYSDSKVSFENTIYNQTHDYEVRAREFAWLNVSGNAPESRPQTARVEKLAGGFYNASGAAADPAGNIYFVDAKWQRIYRWSPKTRQLTTVRDNALDPVNLAFDKAGNLMVVSYAGKGTVYTFKPGESGEDVTLLKPEPTAARPGMTAVLPVNHWRLENDFLQTVPVRKPYQYVLPDGTMFLPAGEDFVSGQLYYGSKLNDVIRAFQLAPAAPGKPFYVSDESEQKTYQATIAPDGTLTDVKLFAWQGGEALTVDAEGNVYLAAGQVYVYNPAGKLIDTIEVPERPRGLVFGGPDGKTLFITAGTSLYAVK